jgi:sporulation protein YlmC with PRC-barrel domain
MTTVAAGSGGTTLFATGAEVRCRDGSCGTLTRVIIDPVMRTLTHLVVEPRDGETGRLVPLALVEHSSPGQIGLSCTMQEFGALAASQETDYFPVDGPYGSYYGGYARGYGYRHDDVRFWPYYGLGYGYGWGPEDFSHESVPAGEVTVRRGDPVHATDGDIGRVAGLVIRTSGGQVTHVLLEEGHLARKKEVAIPVRSITRVGDVAEVAMTRHEIQRLPDVDVDHPESRNPAHPQGSEQKP